MQEEYKKGNKLIDLIKDSLNEEDKKIIAFINFEKTNEEIIQNLIKANILNFKDSKNENK